VLGTIIDMKGEAARWIHFRRRL